MPIAKEIELVRTDYEPTPTIPMPYQSATIDSKQMHPDNLLTYLEGPPIVGDYYKLVVDKDNELSGNMLARDPVLQQYIKIENFECKLQNDAAFTQNEENRLFDGTISVMIYASTIVPNVGDLFVVDSMVSVPVIYQVSGPVERKSIYNKTCYLVELSALDFANGNRIIDMADKVIETRVFVKEFLQYGNAPVINKGEFESLVDLANLRRRTILDYFKNFYSDRLKTLLVPSGGIVTYDTFLTNFVLSTISTDDSIYVSKINQYNIGFADESGALSILDLLIHPADLSLDTVFKKAGRIDKNLLATTVSISSIRLTPITEVISPIDTPFNVDDPFSYRTTKLKASAPISLIGERKEIYIEGLNTRHNLDEKEPPAIIPAAVNHDYIFSDQFYNGKGSSLLEEIVLEYINKIPSDPRKLQALYSSIKTWGMLERFYYLPILIMLTKRLVRKL